MNIKLTYRTSHPFKLRSSKVLVHAHYTTVTTIYFARFSHPKKKPHGH